ncbi:MAG: SLC13 family permease [Geminicoccaceae bacterium]|nr:SLC13 family permease [Geminicoccaceae bacterium]
MTFAQGAIVAIFVALMGLFVWGRVRHDVVAMGGLLAGVLLGVVPAKAAFSGFGETAVVSVAAMLVLTRTLTETGATDWLSRKVEGCTRTASMHVGALSAVTALISTVMNNVGALALIMPIAMQTAAKTKRSPSILLMPISFAALLGGLVTLIGTPPNILASSFLEKATGRPFSMFSYTPVGLPLAVVGVVFMATIGWRFLPKSRRSAEAESYFAIADYVTEAKVGPKTPLIDRSFGQASDLFARMDAAILGLLRDGRRLPNVPRRFAIREGDILIVEAAPASLQRLSEAHGLEFGDATGPAFQLSSDDVRLSEVVIRPGSELDGRSGNRGRLAQQFNVTLLAIAREGGPIRDRLDRIVLKAGDVLLLQGETVRLNEVIRLLGCLPLAERRLQMAKRRHARPTLAVFAVAILAVAVNAVDLPVALCTAIAVLVAVRILPARELYDAIDWPVIVLLAALIPLGTALQETGVTQNIALAIVRAAQDHGPIAALGIVFLVTMITTDILNNAATVVIMAPVAIETAQRLHVSVETFVMTVAIASSCAFLTPIGHQNNTIVMGPGGYTFTDYMRLGAPLQAVLILFAVPLLLLVWGL